MQLEPNPERGMKVRLTPEELTRAISHYDNIEDETDDKRYVALALMGRAGLRSFEVPQIRWEHIDDANENSWHKLKVPQGKGDKYRETRLPHELYLFIRTYIRGLDDRDAPLVDVTERTIRRWVEDVREDFGGAAYDEDENVVEWTKNEDWKYLTTHDFRRSWAHILDDADVEPRVIQTMGGWKNLETMYKHYVGKPSDERINDQLSKLGNVES